MVPSPEEIARLEEMWERHHPSTTAESTGLVDRVCAASRAENRAAAAQLAAIGELFSYRLSRCSETEEWAVDTEAAVCAEVGAELRIGPGVAACATPARCESGCRGSVRCYRLPDVSDDRVPHRFDHRPRRAGR